MNVGFIGLGIMGRPMAGHLVAAREKVFLNTRRQVPDELLAAGGIACDSPREVAEGADAVILMVPDTPDVNKVLFGAHGVAEGLSEGKLVIDMSSISPTATIDFARRINERGCDYLDAPVSGGEAGARNATLSIMVGGPAAALERVRDLFEIMGKTIVHVGPNNGDGQVAKCANQIVVALTIQAVAEGLLFASRAGADVVKIREALMGGIAASRILEIHGERMIKRDLEPGFRIRLHQKDLNNALASAQDMALALPATALAQEMFTAAVAHGAGDLDHAAFVRGLEELSDHEISGRDD